MIGKLLSALLPGLFDIIDQAVTDKDKANEIKAALQKQVLSNEATALQEQAKIVVAEIQAGGPASTWRPHLMYLIMFLFVFNGIVVPLAEAFLAVDIPTLEAWDALPDKMWDLLMIGMGGYIIGRSAEKVAPHLKIGGGGQ